MKAVFADTSFFLASLNPDDSLHDRAIAVSRELEITRVTTAFVLLEVANAMRRPGQRTRFVEFRTRLAAHPLARIVPVSAKLLERGHNLYASRADKHWSLTDCTSFIVMSDLGIADALTHDRDFEQAGFTALLR